MTVALIDLAKAELLHRDTDDIWILNDELLESQELAQKFYDTGLFTPVNTLLDGLRKSGETASAEDLERFLSVASFCGAYIPFDLICNYLKLPPDRADTLIDLLTDDLKDSQDRPLLKYLSKHLSDFGDMEIFSFENPILAPILRYRMDEPNLNAEACQFFRSIKDVLPTNNRSIAGLYLSVLYYLPDDGEQEIIQSELNWWVGQNEADHLKALLIDLCNQGLLDPEQLWSLNKVTHLRWPSWRSLAVLEAYGEQKHGMPFDRRAAWLSEVGECIYQQGRYPKALEYHHEALDIRGKTLQPHHSDIATSLSKIGSCLRYQGNVKGALEHHREALDIWKETLRPDHPDIAMSLNNIGICLNAQGKFKAAMEHYSESLDINKKTLRPDHPNITANLNNIGHSLNAQGEDKRVLEYHREALDIRRDTFLPDYPNIAKSLNNIGYSLKAQGDTKGALQYFSEALTIFKKTLPPDHQDIATSLSNIGSCFNAQGNFRRAQEHYRKALDIYKKTLPPDSDLVIRVQNAIESCQDKLNPQNNRNQDVSETTENHMPRRNCPCPCGSGKRYKHCHGRVV